MKYRAPSVFPPIETADEDGLLAITPTITADLLLDAYFNGIFPWSEGPARWYSPDPRAIFLYDHIRLPRRLGKLLRAGGFRVTFDTAFRDVITACGDSHEEDGIWIGPEFIDAYTELNEQGYAHSVEVWQDNKLVGGLYGVQIGAVFSGESMFHRVSNASKIAFAALVHHLYDVGIKFIDAQVLNPHTHRLGAVLVTRRDYLTLLRYARDLSVADGGVRWPKEPQNDFTTPLTLPPEKA